MNVIFRLLCCVLLVVCNLSAYAASPEPEAFEVSGIRFGNSYDEVQQIARRLELRQVRVSQYLKRGQYPASIAYQVFVKCPSCINSLADPSIEPLEVQYSPATGRVVAISRKLIFENPVHKDLMEKAIFERFGRQVGAQKGSFAWKKSGQQDRMYEEHQRCGVGALPLKMRNPTCKVAALFSYETLSNNQMLVKSQNLMVVDWGKLDEELALVEQSEANENANKLEEAKQQTIPKI